AVGFKVVAPAGEFHSVIAHRFDFGCQVCEGKVGPLAGEECYRSCHKQKGFCLMILPSDGGRSSAARKSFQFLPSPSGPASSPKQSTVQTVGKAHPSVSKKIYE